ncbi:hypothetical protein ACFVUY_38290 [Kitasatospora sp. NPDC058063]|uniref:hypothetical protein n=1 Tax=unclassified Kitasatospora TaxID=2633591 RepID=UPI00366A261B
MEELPEGVDHDVLDRYILDRRIGPALRMIRDASGCRLNEALGVFCARYEELRRDRPDEFKLSREEYAHEVYT